MSTKLTALQVDALVRIAKGRTSYTPRWATLQALQEQGLIEYRNDPRWPNWPSGGRFHLTDAGRAALAETEPKE